jgi:Ca-activated chloride channel family protein
MTMRIGNEVTSAQIQEVMQARQTFEKAKAEGKAASLLEQHRPNMFTQRIANLMPGLPIDVEIEYTQSVPRIDGAYELVVPMVVGPRFQPPGAGVPPDEETSATGEWKLERLPEYPATAGIDVPERIVPGRVELQIDLEAPLPLQSAHSDTHQLAVRHVSSTQQEIRLAAGKVLDNRDFVLRYQFAGELENAGLLSHWQAGEGGYFSLLIEPPHEVADSRVLPREMVFLLDCSGSMGGLPMRASKRFMREALAALRPTDSFRIIRFSDSATEFSQRPLQATPMNIARGLAYTASLHGSGGTMMSSGITQALSAPIPAGSVRNVVFLTDGYIGNEVSVLALVEELLRGARLYAFGVGAGVNRYLLGELGRVGRGFTRYFDPTRSDESVEAVVADLVTKLQTPVLTDVQIDWGNLPVTEVLPAQLPDLYAGDSIRVTGRYRHPAQGSIQVRGNSRQHDSNLTLPVNLASEGSRPALRRIWARNAVADRMHQFITPTERRVDGVSNDALQAAVTDLGLAYGLTTRWTAFVAVSRKIYNTDPAGALESDVALAKVAGVSSLAYGQPAMAGYAAPEPGAWLSLLMLAILGLPIARRVARKSDPRPMRA